MNVVTLHYATLFAVCCITESLMELDCEYNLRSTRLEKSAAAAGSIHHNLAFNWCGDGSERKRATEVRRKKRKGWRSREKRGQSASTPG